ncbi:phosphopantetheine-binding protein [Micromonospora sp. NPDC050397]|uniref:phosphopantetheine-binding protein n=1 Tax=Micromonospora sp. NPDC050397 TaxID=3364279 RepID=UPI00384B55F0
MGSINVELDAALSAGESPSAAAFLELCAFLLPATTAEPTLDSNLFELGADSLTITALAAEIQARWNVVLDPSDLFLAEDLAEVYSRLTAERDGDPPAALPARPPGPPQESWAQLARLRPDGPWAGPGPRGATVEVDVRVTGRLDEERLRGALRAVATRHEVLRTFLGPAGELALHDSPSVLLDAVDERPATHPTTHGTGTSGALWRARLEAAHGHTELSLSLDRLVADEGSVPILLADLARAYNSGATTLAAAAPGFYDWAAWQRATYPAERAGAPAAARPVARLAARTRWPAGSLVALSRLAEQCGVGLDDVLTLLLGLTLGRSDASGAPVRVCVPLDNRDDPRTRELVGPVHTRALLTLVPDGTVPVTEVLRAVRRERDDRAAFASAPYGSHQPRSGDPTDTPAADAPLALVCLRTGIAGTIQLGGARGGWRIRADQPGYLDVPLALEGTPDDDGNLDLVLWHDPGHYDGEPAERLLGELTRLAESLLTRRNQPVARLLDGLTRTQHGEPADGGR